MHSPRTASVGIIYHVLNRETGRVNFFNKLTDYRAFEQIQAQVPENFR